MTFDRRKNSTATSIESPHAFSYWGVFGRMIVIYQAEFWVITLLTIYFYYVVLGIYAFAAKNNVVIFKFQKAFATGDFSTITPED